MVRSSLRIATEILVECSVACSFLNVVLASHDHKVTQESFASVLGKT